MYRAVLSILFTLHVFVLNGQSKQHEKLEFASKIIESDPDTAFFISKIIYLKAEKEGELYLKAKSGQIIGKVLFYQGTFNQSIEYLIESSEILQELDVEMELAETYIWLGAVYQYARQYPLARKYYLDALRINQKHRDQLAIANNYSWIGHYYEKLESPDSALYYQYQALIIYNGFSVETKGLADVYDNLGSLYEDRAQYDSAFQYFQNAFHLNGKLHRTSNQIINLNNLGDIYRKTDQYEKALLLTDSALRMAKEHDITYQIRSAYKDLSKIHALRLDSAKSFLYLDSALTLYEEIFNLESAQRIAQLQYIYETDRKEKQIAGLQKEKVLTKRLSIAVGISLILIILVGGFVLKNQQLKLINNKKKEKLVSTEQDLLVADLKNSLLNEQNLRNELINRELIENQLREELSSKSQLLTIHTISVIRKNNILEEMREELKKIKKMDRNSAGMAINKLIGSIQMIFNEDEDWNTFQSVFEDIHVDFFKNLNSTYPDLTPADLRLAALLKLNLNSRDIATILGISTDSLRVSRYRLKKKMNLESESLVSHLVKM